MTVRTEEVIKSVGTDGFTVWNGVAGYDTRPYAVGPEGKGYALPVGYWEGDACNHIPDTGDIPAGDVVAAVLATPIGWSVVVPEFSGCHHEAETRFLRVSEDQWKEEYSDFRDY